MEKITDYYASMIFDNRIMKAMHSDKVYRSLKQSS